MWSVLPAEPPDFAAVRSVPRVAVHFAVSAVHLQRTDHFPADAAPATQRFLPVREWCNQRRSLFVSVRFPASVAADKAASDGRPVPSAAVTETAVPEYCAVMPVTAVHIQPLPPVTGFAVLIPEFPGHGGLPEPAVAADTARHNAE